MCTDPVRGSWEWELGRRREYTVVQVGTHFLKIKGPTCPLTAQTGWGRYKEGLCVKRGSEGVGQEGEVVASNGSKKPFDHRMRNMRTPG